jgi:GNAT superfamily N-acetyltransferase
MQFYIKRTTANDKDFQLLVKQLDHELWVELEEDQATYDQHNKVPGINTALVAYDGDEPVACGCFKVFDENTVEIKRMFVRKDKRGKGLSKRILEELETWAKEQNYKYSVLETSKYFNTAQNLYSSHGYGLIPNYGPYANLPGSVCMKKELK